MRLIALAGLLLVAAWPAPALGQAGQDTVVCRSENYQRNECALPFRRARLVEQLSRSDCIEGQTWGSRRGRLWVSDGCAGRFAPAPGGGSVPGPEVGAAIECRSENFARRECGPIGPDPVLLEQLSRTPCEPGRTWGVDRRGLWVDRGCAGIFASRPGDGHGGGHDVPPPMTAPEMLQCEARGPRATECRFPVPVRQVTLFRQIAREPCREGGNWEWDSRSVRVWDGCGAVFRYWPR